MNTQTQPKASPAFQYHKVELVLARARELRKTLPALPLVNPAILPEYKNAIGVIDGLPANAKTLTDIQGRNIYASALVADCPERWDAAQLELAATAIAGMKDADAFLYSIPSAVNALAVDKAKSAIKEELAGWLATHRAKAQAIAEFAMARESELGDQLDPILALLMDFVKTAGALDEVMETNEPAPLISEAPPSTIPGRGMRPVVAR